MVTTMYDDLIKQLRYCADAITCRNCLWKTECCPTDMQKKAADAIEELRKAVLRLENESGIYDELPMFYIYPTKWIPVAERMPGREWVLCKCRAKIHEVLSLRDGYWYHDPQHQYMSGFVTHWMPLPEAPKDGE